MLCHPAVAAGPERRCGRRAGPSPDLCPGCGPGRHRDPPHHPRGKQSWPSCLRGSHLAGCPGGLGCPVWAARVSGKATPSPHSRASAPGAGSFPAGSRRCWSVAGSCGELPVGRDQLCPGGSGAAGPELARGLSCATGGGGRPVPGGARPGRGDPGGELVAGQHVQGPPRCRRAHAGASALGDAPRVWGSLTGVAGQSPPPLCLQAHVSCR